MRHTRSTMRTASIFFLILLALGLAALWTLGRGVGGSIDGTRVEPEGEERAAALARDHARAQRSVARPAGGQILFGDLHVHTTLSSDAFMLNLPMLGGAGAMTPADACDFARHCAALDFWSINDHANSLFPEDWKNTVDAIRGCNERAGDPLEPDMVAFLGWEWTQAGLTADTHYGHKNVVLAHTDDDRIPARPIGARANPLLLAEASPLLRGGLSVFDDRFRDLSRRIVEQSHAPVCGEGHVRDLAKDCREVAPTPPELFRKLDEWGHDSIVIPHGTAWGIYTPPDSTWDKQLEGDMHDPERQTMIEVYSGHGDSEVYRDWRAFDLDDAGIRVCPEESPGYLPACRQAGRIVRERCLGEGAAEAECEERAAVARRNALEAGTAYVNTIEGGDASEWLDAGQCRDCRQPSFSYVPTGSAQYIAALGNFDQDPDSPRRFRLGFMASSDNHSARAGTGYKELRAMTDGGTDHPGDASALGRAIRGSGTDAEGPKPARSRSVSLRELSPLSALADVERNSSFQYTGGLVAVHAAARNREAIWQALESNAVYGTSGPRILLWFDLLSEGDSLPMGSEVVASSAPRLRVRAAGSLEQKPGCPEPTLDALGEAQLERLCLGECYYPSDRRRPIERIEVVRIRPQAYAGEEIGSLIDDPWRVFECEGEPAGCVATFEDPDFLGSGRDAVYYARVFEPPTPTVNAQPLGCERDTEGRCLSVSLCSDLDDCRRPDAPRAWSSPIYVDHPAARRSR